MINRKDLKRQARGSIKRHYMLIVVLCAVSIFLGVEFTGTASDAQTLYDMITGNVTSIDVGDQSISRNFWNQVLEDVIDNDLEQGREDAAKRIEEYKDSDSSSILGRSRGILASIVNNISSGQLYITIATALYNISHSEGWTAALMILASLLLIVSVWVFFRNFYRAVLRRAMLEARTYKNFPPSHLLHINHVRRWMRVSMTLLLESVFQTLWNLTIVGGFIKYYSYFLVPYIVAENPEVKPREAIQLSRKMMNGHKWQCFVLDLSFLGWYLLGFATFGLVNIFWRIPYQVATYTEFYVALRENALETAVPGAEVLNDTLLYVPADEALLKEAYSELAGLEEIIDEDIIELGKVQGFLARNFGIWVGPAREKQIYTRQLELRQQTRLERMEMDGDAYPERMNPLSKKNPDVFSKRASYLAPCTVWSLIIIFFAFCMVGWLWEVSLHLVTEGRFVNRGALHGPWLPIYGSGVAMITVLLYRLRKNPALEAVGIILLCGVVEYFTSFFMELASGMRWWDYTGYFLNLNGRICAEGLTVFALGGMSAVYLLVPVIDKLVSKIKRAILIPVCCTLIVLFTGDLIYSHYVPNTGEGITDYNSWKEEGTKQ